MSDRMTNTEVEDVLASIRRLVSDDKRPEAVPEHKQATDRLVLTPSLRVMEDASPETAEDSAADQHDDTLQTDDTPLPHDDADNTSDVSDDGTDSDAVDSDDVFASVAAAVSIDAAVEDEAADDEDAAEEGEIIALEDGVRMGDHNDAPDTDFVSDEDDVEPEGDDIEVVPQDDANLSLDTLHGEADDLDHDQPEETVAEFKHHTWSEEIEDDVPDDSDAPEDTSAFDAVEESFDPVDDAPEAQTLSEKIAALETLIGRRDEEFEPDDPGVDDYAGTEAPAMAWEDADDAPAQATFVHVAPHRDDEQTGAQVFPNEEDVLDEDALRELVSDIVREELQGALGERITRNVRKLVRREIHRALAAQELE